MGHSIAVPAPGKPLAMLGSNVFKFSMTVVPEQVQAYLARNGCPSTTSTWSCCTRAAGSSSTTSA